MKVLVTGADGFIGSHLVENLLNYGYEVRALCIYNSQGSWGWLDNSNESVKTSVEVFLGDIRDPDCVREAMKGCAYVFHLAALISIPYSYKASRSYVETNVLGTLNIIQAAKELDIKKVVHTSTSETYGTAQFVPITENHPLVAQSPYAASKIGADQLALSYWRSFGTPVTVLRPFNTYGPRQSNRAVIPTIITQIANGKREIKLGALSPTRDFNFVQDTCLAFLEVAKSEKTIGKVINASSYFEISIENTFELIKELMNADVSATSDERRLRPDLSEVNRLFGDNSLLKEITNWKPKYKIDQGLIELINWLKLDNNIKKYKPKNYNI